MKNTEIVDNILFKLKAHKSNQKSNFSDIIFLM